MTTLNRTKLTTFLKINCAANAVACQDKYGAATKIANAFGISKPTFYSLRRTTEQVLTNYFNGQNNPTIEISDGLIKRTIVALHIMAPNSYRAIEDLLPIIYPEIKLSFGAIWNICHEAETQATIKNKMEDLNNIKNIALDELFSQGSPVLGGVDLDTGYIIELKLSKSRGVEDWTGLLTEIKHRGLDADIVVADAAQGIAAGVSEVFPQAQQRDDIFHVLYNLNNTRNALERVAYGKINAEMKLANRLRRTPGYEPRKRTFLKSELTRIKKKVDLAIKHYDTFNNAVNMVIEAVDYITATDLRLRSLEESKKMLQTAACLIESMDYYDSKRIAKYLRNRIPGLLLSIGYLHEGILQLQEQYGEKAVLMGCAFYSFRNLLNTNKEPWNNKVNSSYMAGAYLQLKDILGRESALEVLELLEKLLQQRYRASSPIEGVNAALRPHLYCRKNVSQNYLDLYRFYQNRKVKRWGRHKGTSAHEKVTGLLCTDWLVDLGFTLH